MEYPLPPLVQKGDLVLWHPDGDRTQPGFPAFVTEVNAYSVALNIMDNATHNFRLRDGVPHLDDPRCGGEHVREAGGWDLAPQTRLLRRLEALCDRDPRV